MIQELSQRYGINSKTVQKWRKRSFVKDADRIYAATQRGLMLSTEGGRRWRRAHEARQPATMVHVTPDGTIYAFIAGTGLIRTGASRGTQRT